MLRCNKGWKVYPQPFVIHDLTESKKFFNRKQKKSSVIEFMLTILLEFYKRSISNFENLEI